MRSHREFTARAIDGRHLIDGLLSETVI